MFILKKNAKKYVYTDLKTITSVEEQRLDIRFFMRESRQTQYIPH